MTEDTQDFLFSTCVRFPLDFQCLFVVVLIIIIIIIIIIINGRAVLHRCNERVGNQWPGNDTSIQAGTAADSAAAAKKAKYTDIANTHMFILVAIETGGPWNVEAIELIQEIGRRITLINGEFRETEYLFQRI